MHKGYKVRQKICLITGLHPYINNRDHSVTINHLCKCAYQKSLITFLPTEHEKMI